MFCLKKWYISLLRFSTCSDAHVYHWTFISNIKQEVDICFCENGQMLLLKCFIGTGTIHAFSIVNSSFSYSNFQWSVVVFGFILMLFFFFQWLISLFLMAVDCYFSWGGDFLANSFCFVLSFLEVSAFSLVRNLRKYSGDLLRIGADRFWEYKDDCDELCF